VPGLARARLREPGALTDGCQVHEANTQRADEDQAFLMNSMERMRARCTVPRDVVSIYEALNKARRGGRRRGRRQAS